MHAQHTLKTMPFVWLISSLVLLRYVCILQSNPFSYRLCDRWHKINSSIIGLHASPYLYIVNTSDRICFVTINRLMDKMNIRSFMCLSHTLSSTTSLYLRP